jgi:hypothetical protein
MLKKVELRGRQTHQKTGIEMAYIDREGKNHSSYPIQTILAVEGKREMSPLDR